VAPGSPVPVHIEVTHLSATAEPLAVVDVPEGTYVSGTVTVANAELTFVNLLDGSIVSQTFTGPFPVVVSPNLVVGATPLSVNFDFDVDQSVTITGGTATFNPAVLVTNAFVPTDPDAEDEKSGKLEDVTGRISSIASGSFALEVPSIAQSLTILVSTTGTNPTEFGGDVANFSDLAVDMIAEVDAVTQSDGTLLATKVGVEDANAEAEAEGFVTDITVSDFTMLVHELAGPGANPADIGELLTFTSDAGTEFILPDDKADLSGLPFVPSFSSFSDLALGQQVGVETETTFNDPVEKVSLELQTLRGTISSLSSPTAPATFVLTLATDAGGFPASAFSILTGEASVDVVWQASTDVDTVITNGAVVRARGLLFFDTASSRYKLVASRVTGP
jgi:hypothetical protein